MAACPPPEVSKDFKSSKTLESLKPPVDLLTVSIETLKVYEVSQLCSAGLKTLKVFRDFLVYKTRKGLKGL